MAFRNPRDYSDDELAERIAGYENAQGKDTVQLRRMIELQTEQANRAQRRPAEEEAFYAAESRARDLIVETVTAKGADLTEGDDTLTLTVDELLTLVTRGVLTEAR